MCAALFAAPGVFPDIDPVGCHIVSSAMAERFAEGSQHHGAIAVTLLPVVWQLLAEGREIF